jgi:hypothetical protein
MAEYIRTIHTRLASINKMAEHLGYLAECFEATGNIKMMEDLETVEGHIKRYTHDIQNAVGDWINTDLKNAREGAKATVEAALAGIKLERDF